MTAIASRSGCDYVGASWLTYLGGLIDPSKHERTGDELTLDSGT